MRLTICLTLACLLLAGCDEIFYAGLDPTSTADLPVFDFGKREDLSGSAKLYGFYVTGRPLDTAAWTTFWDIHVDDGKRYSTVDRLGYGELPPDFHVAQYPESLPSNYVFMGHGGFHGLGRDCWFEITADSTGQRSIVPLTEDEFQRITNQDGSGGK